MALATIITGTVLATGKTFTHGLGTTPDVVIPIGSVLHTTNPLYVSTFNSQIFVIGGAADGIAFRAIAIKLHSIVG